MFTINDTEGVGDVAFAKDSTQTVAGYCGNERFLVMQIMKKQYGLATSRNGLRSVKWLSYDVQTLTSAGMYNPDYMDT